MKFNKRLFLNLSIFLIILRSPIFIITIFLSLFSDKNKIMVFIYKIFPAIIILIFFSIYSILMGNGFGLILLQSRDILLALLVLNYLSAISYKEPRKKNDIYIILKNAFIFISFCKIFLILFVVISGVSSEVVLRWIQDNWHVEMMTLGVENSFLFRLQIPTDSVSPFILFLMCREIFRGDYKANILNLIILSISILLTFSRAYWIYSILLILLAYILEAKLNKKIMILFYTLFIFLFLVSFTNLADFISNIIDVRFGADAKSNNYSSDLERNIQNISLLKSFYEYPFLGHGLGYFIPTLIRSTTTPYLYETQTLSMLMNLGLVGVIILIINIILNVFLDCIRFLSIKKIIISLVLLSLWLGGGSVNPLLFGASGGLILFVIKIAIET